MFDRKKKRLQLWRENSKKKTAPCRAHPPALSVGEVLLSQGEGVADRLDQEVGLRDGGVVLVEVENVPVPVLVRREPRLRNAGHWAEGLTTSLEDF